MRPLRWRVQSNHDGGFDELVVSGAGKDGCLIHAEMMDDRSICVSVGDLMVWAHVDKKGVARVTHTELAAKRAGLRHGKDEKP